MPTITDARAQVESIDLQLLKLIEERTQICTEAAEVGQALDSDFEGESMSLWLEEAADRNLDESSIEKIAYLLNRMCRVEEE